MARQRKGRIKDGRAIFFRFQSLLSHNNNHLTAPCGLAAASDVESGGGGGEAHAAGQWPTPSGQWPILYITMQHTDGSPNPITPRFALSVRHRVRAHSVAAHTPMHSISLYLGLTLAKSYLIYLATFWRRKLKTMQVFKGTLWKLSNTYLLAH